MKPSLPAMFNYIMGMIFFFLCIPLTITTHDAIPFLVGLSGLNILWLIGIQRDLYRKDEKK